MPTLGWLGNDSREEGDEGENAGEAHGVVGVLSTVPGLTGRTVTRLPIASRRDAAGMALGRRARGSAAPGPWSSRSCHIPLAATRAWMWA